MKLYTGLSMCGHSLEHLTTTFPLTVTTDSAKTLVHALIASRRDYCNSVLYQINTNATKTLQSVLHSATRLIV